MSFRPCCVIPSRNHYRDVARVVASAREQGLEVFLIDDASDEHAQSVLAAQAAVGVQVVRRPVRGGKGGAVSQGLVLAVAAGFSHAVQLDADAQHDLTALPALLALARANPDALVSGHAVYDGSVPKARRWGRLLTHFWVWVETLSLSISDSVCGFRCYPLAPTMAVLAPGRVGGFMEFDIEVMVRLHWHGVRVLMLPVRVFYPEGNTSNFEMLRDNWRITKLHTRLTLAMLPRAPGLLWRRFRG